MKVPSDQPRAATWLEEAVRHIIMRLEVKRIEPPEDKDGQALPVVYFEGTSKSIDRAWEPNANSKIRGSVRLTPEGEVRWTTVSVFFGYAPGYLCLLSAGC
jgi:hypothetical protein